MAINQKSRWDDVGVEPPAGEARYQAGEQPIAEYDNWFNKAVVDDIAALNAWLDNLGITKVYFDVEANMPVSGATSELFIATDTNKIYRGTGTGWQLLKADPITHSHAPADISPQGSGSGLDADTLDGYHASSFVTIVEELLDGNLYFYEDFLDYRYWSRNRGVVYHNGQGIVHKFSERSVKPNMIYRPEWYVKAANTTPYIEVQNGILKLRQSDGESVVDFYCNVNSSIGQYRTWEFRIKPQHGMSGGVAVLFLCEGAPQTGNTPNPTLILGFRDNTVYLEKFTTTSTTLGSFSSDFTQFHTYKIIRSSNGTTKVYEDGVLKITTTITDSITFNYFQIWGKPPTISSGKAFEIDYIKIY